MSISCYSYVSWSFPKHWQLSTKIFFDNKKMSVNNCQCLQRSSDGYTTRKDSLVLKIWNSSLLKIDAVFRRFLKSLKKVIVSFCFLPVRLNPWFQTSESFHSKASYQSSHKFSRLTLKKSNHWYDKFYKDDCK